MLYCRFKCLSSLKTGRFWLDVNVFIVYKMEKIVLKEIPTILFVCIVIVVWTFPIVIIESLLKCIVIVIVIVIVTSRWIEIEVHNKLLEQTAV